jgi:sulfane dehydrogenase subunit SoxC
MHIPGRPLSAYGSRSAFEDAKRLVRGIRGNPLNGVSTTPLAALHGILTPSSLHFERHHAGIPDMDPADYRLLVHGRVGKPLLFTLDDLRRLPSVSVVRFIECSGNGVEGYRGKDPALTAQAIDGLVSTSEWTGVLLSTLLREAGLGQGAEWIVAEGFDSAAMTRSIPLGKALDDVLVAYGQNGEALRPEQGYPVRLLVPGWEGNINVKWLRRVEVTDAPAMSREETSKYTDPMPDGTARIFTWPMEAKSIITFPSGGQKLSKPGFYEVTGLAWSGRGRVARVEVTTDGGRAWHLASLQEPVLERAQTRFRYPWHWKGEEAVLMSRAADETGYLQPTREELYAVRGEWTYYHFNNVRAWFVGREGAVTFFPGH